MSVGPEYQYSGYQSRISQELESLAKSLEVSVERDKKLGEQLAYEVRAFNWQWGKAVNGLKDCNNLTENLNKIVATVIPGGKKLSSEIWNGFEAYGLWDSKTEEISDIAKKILTQERFLNDAVVAILQGCDCRIAAVEQK